MPETDPLAKLKDIHLPDPISWWPLAPGWYLLMISFILLIFIVTFWAYKKHKDSLPKKKALVLLKTYKEYYKKESDAQLASAQISELLRRVALVYYPRTEVASLRGEAWLDYLNQTSKGIDFKPIREMLLDSPFKTRESIDLHPLFKKSEQWIKQRGVPCSN